MMKLLNSITLFLFVLSISFYSESSELPTLEDRGLSGPVHTYKAVRTIFYKSPGLWIDGEIDRDREYEFNRNGMEILFKLYLNTNDSVSRTIVYDESTHVQTETNYTENGDTGKTITRQFDVQGNKVEEIYINSDGTTRYRNTYQYNDQNQLIRKKEFSGSGQLRYDSIVERTENEYDQLEELMTMFDSEGIELRKTFSLYNDQRTLIRKDSYHLKGPLSQTLMFDDNGRLIESWEYRYDGILETSSIATYDDSDNTSYHIVNFYSEEGTFLRKLITYIAYDEYDNVIQLERISNDIIEYRYKYEWNYDSYGNPLRVDELRWFGELYDAPYRLVSTTNFEILYFTYIENYMIY
jgi:hypothetical protein